MQASCSRSMPAPCYGKYYVYSSSPALSASDRPRKPKPKKSGTCFANHAMNIRTRGVHEFYNMMWDPAVYRGNTTKAYHISEMDRCNSKKRREIDASIKRRKYPRQKMIGGIVRPTLSLADQEEKIGLGDMGMQTDQYLEEVALEVVKKEMGTQIDEEERAKKDTGGQLLRPFMIGTSMSCQTDLRLTFPFEETVKPIQKQLCHKIMEQSLIETTEEMELEALRREKRKYIQIRSQEFYQLKRAVDAQRAVAEERQMALYVRDQEFKAEQEAESRLGAALFSAGCMGGLLPVTFGVLQLEGFMSESDTNDIYENLVPYMNEEAKKLYGEKRIISRKLLDEILHQVASKREAEVALHEYYPPSTSNQQSTLILSEEDPQDTFSVLSTKLSKIKTKSTTFSRHFGEEE